MSYAMAVRTEQHTFVKFSPQSLPFAIVIYHGTDSSIFFVGVHVVKIIDRKDVCSHSTINTLSSKMLNCFLFQDPTVLCSLLHASAMTFLASALSCLCWIPHNSSMRRCFAEADNAYALFDAFFLHP